MTCFETEWIHRFRRNVFIDMLVMKTLKRLNARCIDRVNRQICGFKY